MLHLLEELLVELAGDALPLAARGVELLGRDPDVLHVAAQHEVHLVHHVARYHVSHVANCHVCRLVITNGRGKCIKLYHTSAKCSTAAKT